MSVQFNKTLILVSTLSLTGFTSGAMAATTCFDFSNSSATGELRPGQSVYLPDGTLLEIRNARTLDGQQIENTEQYAEIHSGHIAGGNPYDDEFHGYYVNLKIEFGSPKSSISMRFAQFGASNGGYLYSTLAANGERIQLEKGFESADGIVLGVNADEQVKISTDLSLAPVPGDGGFHIGSIDFDAFPNHRINAVSIGGVQYYLDDICITD